MKRTRKSIAFEALMFLAASLMLLPLYILVVVSLQTEGEVLTRSLAPPAVPQFSNYADAWLGQASGTLWGGLLSSLSMTIVSVLIVVIVGSAAAYAVVRFPSPRISNGLQAVFLAAITMPVQLGLVSVYAFLNAVNLSGSFIGMVFIFVALEIPLAIFLFGGFLRALPRDYEEAAQVDGAGTWTTYWRIVFPLLRPAAGTLAILAALRLWNEFFIPLVFLNGSPLQPVPVFIYSMIGLYGADWNLIFASLIIALLPVLAFFLVVQKRLIQGIASGLKG